jgi:hypothetical protein
MCRQSKLAAAGEIRQDFLALERHWLALLDRTISLSSRVHPRAHREDAGKMMEQLTGYFRVLQDWQKKKIATRRS